MKQKIFKENIEGGGIKKYCTAINCMDGRVQLPVIKYLQQYFKAEYVDSITEPGPVLILAEKTNKVIVDSILSRLNISAVTHQSLGIAIVAHHDCAGNPAPKDKQITQLKKAILTIREKYIDLEIIGLWVDDNWHIHKV